MVIAMKRATLPRAAGLVLLLALAGSAAQIPPASPPLQVALGPLGPWQIAGAIAGLALGAIPGNANPRRTANVLISLHKITPAWELFVQTGTYAFPAVLGPTANIQALPQFGPVPVAYALWKPGDGVSLRAGILPSLLGPENVFTYQNVNIERGVIWNNLENTVSRAAEVDWSRQRWSGSLQFGDGFYSRSFGAVSGLLSFAPRASDTVIAAFLWPNRATPPNATFHDANARVLELSWTHSSGAWTWTPALVLFEAPESAADASPRPVRVLATALYGGYRWNPEWSVALRLEGAANGNLDAPAGDEHHNPLGTGAGTRLATVTLTPVWSRQQLFVRGEAAWVWLGRFRSGLGFGPRGTGRSQGRAAVELGVAF